jgi:carboxymethylenebutenolidase
VKDHNQRKWRQWDTVTIKTQLVTFPSNAIRRLAFAQPDDSKKHPAIVVIQEWWGFVPHIRDVAERFARERFVALAGLESRGDRGGTGQSALTGYGPRSRPRGTKKLQTRPHILMCLTQPHRRRLASPDGAWGGGLSLSTADSSSDIGAAVAFYGQPLEAIATAKLRVPVLGLDAERAFFYETRLNIHNATAVKDAWEKTLAWFREYLVLSTNA